MNFLDVLIVALALLAGLAGYRRGISWTFFSLLGLLVGLLLGAGIAEPAARHFSSDTGNRSLIGTGLFISTVLLVQGLGTAVGYRMRTATLTRRNPRLTQVDSYLGMVSAVVGTLFAAWYVGVVFSQSQNLAGFARQIQQSAIEQRLARLAPTPPDFMANIQQLLRGLDMPTVFRGLSQPELPDVSLPSDVSTPGIAAASSAVVKVLSYGCGVEAGSGWPIGGDRIVTNAHVVAGAQKVRIDIPGRVKEVDATVVVYDPETDIAVLLAPGANLASLTIRGDDPAQGTQGAVIGYPNGGNEQVVPSAVKGVETAEGRDIYNGPTVRRTIAVLSAQVVPGNSGGPVVDRQGNVIGLVFAASTVNVDGQGRALEGYALTVSQIKGALDASRTATDPISTQSCT